MAADFIALDKTKTEGARIVALANALLGVRQNVAALNANAARMVDAGPDYKVLQARTGVSITYAGDLSTLLLYMEEIFNSNTTVAGADRLARLDEFIARIAGQ